MVNKDYQNVTWASRQLSPISPARLIFKGREKGEEEGGERGGKERRRTTQMLPLFIQYSSRTVGKKFWLATHSNFCRMSLLFAGTSVTLLLLLTTMTRMMTSEWWRHGRATDSEWRTTWNVSQKNRTRNIASSSTSRGQIIYHSFLSSSSHELFTRRLGPSDQGPDLKNTWLTHH